MADHTPGVSTASFLAALALAAAPALAQPVAAPATGDFVRFEHVLHKDRVEADGSMVRTAQLAVVLRDAAAVATFGQLAQPYVEGLGDVRFDEVSIRKADGRVVPVTGGVVEDINPFGMTGTSMSADVRYRKLTVPGLEPGDRLAYTIVLTQKPLVPGRIFGERDLPGMVGDPLQTYELDLPRDAGVAVHLTGSLEATWEDLPGPADRIVRRLSVRPKRPDFGKDGPTEAEVEALALPDVTFSNFRSWPEVAQWWWGLSRDRLQPDEAVRAEAARLVAGKTTPREKLDALHLFVAQRIRYLNVNFGIGRMQPRRAGEVLANKYGDCKDKVALLAALAAAVGLDVRPVLLHSQRRVLHDAVPGPQQFDHAVAVFHSGPGADDRVWMDATNDLSASGYLLPLLRDRPALLIEATGNGRIVRTPGTAPYRRWSSVVLKGALSPEGTLRAKGDWRLRTDGEVATRYGFRITPEDRREALIEPALAHTWKGVKVTTLSASDPSDVAEPFVIHFEAESTPSGRAPDAEWTLAVPLPDFRLPRARTDVTDGKVAEFQGDEYEASMEIALPAGVSARPPVPVTIERPFARLVSEYSVEDGVLKARRKLVVLRSAVGAQERATYEAFRDMVEKDRDQAFVIGPGSGPAGAASAEALRASGLAAWNKKDHPRAVAALQKAAALDPKLKDVHADLGRALRDAGRPQEALEAFTRQVEADPFHESAYADRAYVLMRLDRDREAEKELLKQIEVAPLKAWSHEKLADIRLRQRRYDEAARHYASAVSIEPKDAETWANLGMAHAMAKRPPEARAALDKALALGPSDWVTMRVAGGLDRIGATEAAADAARTAVPSLVKRLGALTPADFDGDDLYWARQLIGAWYLIGNAALAAGDRATAERYLAAAWSSAFLPEAGWGLGLVRHKQGRLADAGRQWATADAMSGWTRPPDFAARLASVTPALPDGKSTLMDLRTVRLRDTSTDDFTSEVALLVGPEGAVEGVKSLSAKDSAAFDRVQPRLLAVRLPFTAPGDGATKIVLRGIVVCNRLSGCSLVRDTAESGPIER